MTTSIKLQLYLTLLILFNVSSFSLRQLYTNEKLHGVCEKAEITMQSTNDSFSEYVKKHGGNSTETLSFFEDLLFEKKVSNIGVMVKKVAFYIFVFVLAVIVLISWVCFGACCICSCCLFEKKKKKANCFSDFIANLVSIGLFAILAILGYTSIGLNSGFSKYFSGSICSFFQFFNHTLEGDTKNPETLPRWIGLINIENELNVTIEEIKGIADAVYVDVDVLEEKINSYSKIYEGEINNSSEDFVEKLPSPSDSAQLIATDYVTYFETSITGIRAEFDTMKSKINEGISEMRSQIDNVKSLTNTLNETSESIVETIDQTSSKIVEFRGKFASQVFSIHEIVSENIYKAFQVIFGLFASFALIGGGILLLHWFCESCSCKFIVHILWMGLLLFIVCGLIIGGILGIVATISTEVIPIMAQIFNETFITSDAFIEKVGNFTEIVSYLSVCLEEDGDLLSKLDFQLEIEDFDNLIQTIKTGLNESYVDGEKYLKPEILTPLKSKVVSYQKDYGTVFDLSNSSLIPDIIEQLNRELQDTSDNFATILDKCPDGTQNLLPNITREDGVSYCLLVQDWSTDEIEQLYPGKDTLYPTYNHLKTFVTANNKRLQDMFDSIEIMETCYVQSVKETLKQINGTVLRVDSFVDLYDNKIRKDKTLIQKFNCIFIKDDLITFIDQLFFKFTRQANTVGTICIICSIIAYIAVMVLITSVHTKMKKKKTNSYEIEFMGTD